MLTLKDLSNTLFFVDNICSSLKGVSHGICVSVIELLSLFCIYCSHWVLSLDDWQDNKLFLIRKDLVILSRFIRIWDTWRRILFGLEKILFLDWVDMLWKNLYNICKLWKSSCPESSGWLKSGKESVYRWDCRNWVLGPPLQSMLSEKKLSRILKAATLQPCLPSLDDSCERSRLHQAPGVGITRHLFHFLKQIFFFFETRSFLPHRLSSQVKAAKNCCARLPEHKYNKDQGQRAN